MKRPGGWALLASGGHFGYLLISKPPGAGGAGDTGKARWEILRAAGYTIGLGHLRVRRSLVSRPLWPWLKRLIYGFLVLKR